MSKTHTFDYDLIVIGSGAGGSGAATIAARAGKRVAVIEAEAFGGNSPNWGDVPIKSLLHVARLYDDARHGDRFGLRTSTLGYNYPSIRAWKDLAIKRTGSGGNRGFYEKHGISVFNGVAHFLSPNEITVNRRHLSAKYFLIATGSTATIPEIPGLKELGFETTKDIIDHVRPPKSLVIIGGGTLGIELTQLLASFGTKITIIEKAARLLPDYDQDAGELIERLLTEQKGVSVLTQARVLSVEKEGLGKRVRISRGGAEKSIRADEIMIATGRTPQVDLGLENASVAYTGTGITVNSYLQTSAKHIFAAGDVIGRDGHTHSALLESRVAAHNIFNKEKIVPDYRATPHIIFSFPEIAQVGLSEDDCARRDLSVNKAVAPLNIVSRSITTDFRDGFVKILADKKGVIIGATIVAPHAGEMIHELALAVRHGLTAHQIAETPHAFLSWSEAIRVAASKLG